MWPFRKPAKRIDPGLGYFQKTDHIYNNARTLDSVFNLHWARLGKYYAVDPYVTFMDNGAINTYYRVTRNNNLEMVANLRKEGKGKASPAVRNQKFYLYALRMWRDAAIKYRMEILENRKAEDESRV